MAILPSGDCIVTLPSVVDRLPALPESCERFAGPDGINTSDSLGISSRENVPGGLRQASSDS